MKWQLQVIAACVLALSVAAAYVYHLGGERATLAQRLHASDSTIHALSQRARITDTVYVRDTVRLRVAVQHWDTVKAGVDTITVPVPVEVVKYIVATADTAIRACQSVVLTCEQRVAQRDSQIVALKAQRPLLLGKQESTLKRVSKDVGKVLLLVGGGYLVGKKD